jgi:hypothetical protein
MKTSFLQKPAGAGHVIVRTFLPFIKRLIGQDCSLKRPALPAAAALPAGRPSV